MITHRSQWRNIHTGLCRVWDTLQSCSYFDVECNVSQLWDGCDLGNSSERNPPADFPYTVILLNFLENCETVFALEPFTASFICSCSISNQRNSITFTSMKNMLPNDSPSNNAFTLSEVSRLFDFTFYSYLCISDTLALARNQVLHSCYSH